MGSPASLRTLAAIADVTVVVESTNTPRELVGARLAQGFDKTVAAVPGRITSRASGGPHALLREGVRLICEAGDVLELLSEADRPAPGLRVADSPDLELEPRLRTMLERVGAGADTPGKLDGGKSGLGETLRALSELELLGLLARGDGGRYVLRHSLSR
jgi:DNA processing protein